MGGKKKQEKEKPLEKMTATELRDVAKEMTDITGAHGMNKTELVAAIKQARGIEDAPSKKPKKDIRKIKAQIREVKTKHQQAMEGDDKKMAAIYRRKISRLKKKTRNAA